MYVSGKVVLFRSLSPARLYVVCPVTIAANARLSALWDAIKHLPNAYDVVGIIAHNPGVTHLANEMSDDFNIDHLATCGIVGFEADVEDWKNFEKASKRNCYYDDPSRYF
jgi:phosphohistidine phosphatase SixA